MATLPVAAGVGAGLGMLGSFYQGQQAATAAKFNANVASTNAGLVISQSQNQAKLQQVQSEMALGSQQAGYGASGVSTSGTGMSVLQSNAARAEVAKQTILYNGQVQATALQNQAKFYNNQVGADLTQGVVGGLAKGMLSYAQIQSSFGSGTGGTGQQGVDYSNVSGGNLTYTGSFGNYGDE